MAQPSDRQPAAREIAELRYGFLRSHARLGRLARSCMDAFDHLGLDERGSIAVDPAKAPIGSSR